MIDFDWPWAFALLPLPWLFRWVLPKAKGTWQPALHAPFLNELEHLKVRPVRRTLSLWPLGVAAGAWFLLVTAAANPQWLGKPIPLPFHGRDLLLAVDLSGSMEQTDFIINGRIVDRLTATKVLAGDFISRRAGDRIGLLLFGEQAYLHVPLTFDHQTLTQLLNEARIGLAGQKTAIGDAIGLAVKRLTVQDQQNGVLILLTDGANTAGILDPLKAAELAQASDLKIYTIGIGAETLTARDPDSPWRMASSTELDEDSLQAIAQTTGGQYFRARSSGELEQIYATIDTFEPSEREGGLFRPTRVLYPWPLGGALAMATTLILAGLFGRL